VVTEHLSDRKQLGRETKQERREERRAKEKAKMLHHGKSLARVYRNAVSKRARTARTHKQSS